MATGFLLTGCGQVGALFSRKKDDNFGKLPEVPNQLLAGGGEANVTITPASSREIAAGVDPASLTLEQGGVAGLTPESDLIFTDPDDVEASEAAIQGLFGDEENGWYDSHTEAKNRALLEGKPLLIVFTNLPSGGSGGSPASALLEKELLARKDFSDWAKENVVRLKLDFNVKGLRSAETKKQNLALRKKKYLESLRQQYKVRGYPAMLVVGADGSVVQAVRGYSKGGMERTWGLLKTGIYLSEERQLKFEAKLKKKGYRRWTGKNDQKVLARLAKYKDGKLLLIAPNGVRYVTSESNLSRDDRNWIEEQKDKRLQR